VTAGAPGARAGDEQVERPDRPFDLLVAGDLNPDVILTGTPDEVEFGHRERLVGDATLTVGGSAGIVACGAARLGLRTAFVSLVGNDDTGRYVTTELAARGIDVGGVLVQQEAPTGMTVSLVRATGDDRAILTSPGCIPLFDAGMVTDERLGSARHLHVASFFLQPKLALTLEDLFERAHAAGLTTSLDCNDDPANEWDEGLFEILPHTDLFFANRREALKMTRRRDGDLGPSLEQLASYGTLPIVKLGEFGAIAWSGGVGASIPVYPVDVRDTVGAGDSFTGGFLYAWLGGQDLARSLAFGVACGSLSTRSLGGVVGQPTLDEASAAAEWLLARAGLEDG
jgi:sugar/nucleoside kinase (ribokinase family)